MKPTKVRSLASAGGTVLLALLISAAPTVAAGTGTPPSVPYLVRDINPSGNANPVELTNASGILYFAANDGTSGRELWKSDGTPEGTRRVRDIWPGVHGSAPFDLTAAKGRIYFVANDGSHGRELWTSDGTTSGTRRLTDINPGLNDPYPRGLAVVRKELFFSVHHSGREELWKSDGTVGGTSLVQRFDDGVAIVGRPAGFRGKLYFHLAFVGGDAEFGLGLWRTDGTAAGTQKFFSGRGFLGEAIVRAGTHLFFTNRGNLWVTLGTSSATNLDVSVSGLANADGTLFFTGYAIDGDPADAGLWKSDGTVAGTKPVKALSNPFALTAAGHEVFFENYVHGDPQRVLWASNGTAAGTGSVLSVDANQELSEFTNVSGTLCLIVDDALWQSDGTETGTEMVATVGNARSLTSAGGSLYFAANDGTNGRELWRYVP
jgi:ELWxxDGT repeat protein